MINMAIILDLVHVLSFLKNVFWKLDLVISLDIRVGRFEWSRLVMSSGPILVRTFFSFTLDDENRSSFLNVVF
jgi:hypothetical protein